jgi:DNA-binding NtrC family response regulator
MRRLVEFHWPGNVRELENIIERGVALTNGAVLDAADIHLDEAQAGPSSAVATFLPEGMTLEQWEEEMIREALRRSNGNKSQAARLLGLSRNALRYRLTKIGVPDEPEGQT